MSPVRPPTRSLRSEIVAGFATLVLALAVMGGYAIERQARAGNALWLQNSGYLPLSGLLTTQYANQSLLVTQLEYVVEERDAARTRSWITGARATRRGFIERARQAALDARRFAHAGRDVAALTQVEAALGRVGRLFREDERAFSELFEALSGGERERARGVARALVVREQTATDELRAARGTVVDRMQALARDSQHEQLRTLRVLAVVAAVALAIGLFTLLSARRALQPLALLIARVRAVAGGDLSRRERVPARHEEIGELAREFDNMVGEVDKRDTALREKAEAIARAEQHLEQVVATLRAAVMVVGHDGVVESANPAADALADGAALRGRAFEHTPFGAVTDVARAVRETCAGGAGASLLAVPMGEQRALDVTVVPFRAPGGQAGVVGALVVADDVTEREQARARLLQNERLAAIGRMAAHVTHEVRNPLSSMALNAEMLADEARALGSPSPEVLRLVGAIQREIDRLTGITEEYLRVARLPRPRLELEDVGALVEEAVSFMRAELTRAGIDVHFAARAGAPAALVDEMQLRQALLNLLRNARDALEGVPQGARAIRVTVAPSRGGVEIALCDSGPGIQPEARKHLFELFFTTKEKGSGLGLPLTREIVLAHGGTIDVTGASEQDGGGARFVIWLPAAPAREDAPPSSSSGLRRYA